MRVLVGMSGGVDSSTLVLMLKEQGHEVVGVTMAIWGKNGVYKEIQEKLKDLPQKTHAACLGPNEDEKIEETKMVAKQLGVELHVIDCSGKYDEIVLNNFKKEYLDGRTPNPCIRCNALVKFGLLPQLAKESGIKFDKFATGHYARVEKDANGRYLLKKGIEGKKDQSYFLYRLTQEQLANIWMPLGTKTKEEIREYAKSKGLVVAEKPDSQDFYEGDYNELLQVPEKIGNIVDTNGKVLGTHKGFWNYTIGQRKGLGVSSTEPLYVVELRKDTNEVVVGSNDKTMKNILYANELNFIGIEKLNEEIVCEAKIRSSQIPQKVKVTPINEDRIKVEFENMQKSIAIGQSIVLYDDDIILGGGIIDSIE